MNIDNEYFDNPDEDNTKDIFDEPDIDPNDELISPEIINNKENSPSNSPSNSEITVLPNVKWEKFCQAVVKYNGDVKKSLEEAGYKYSRSYFSQLKARPEIQKRIQEIVQNTCNGNIALLTERLEILSDIARNKSLSKNIRIKALAEIHRQCGDNVTKLDINNNSVIKYVEVELPKKIVQLDDEDIEIQGNELDGLDDFLLALENRSK